MKRFTAFLLAFVMVLGLATAVSANDDSYTVRINGNGNNARIQVLYNGAVVHTSAARPANNAWYQVTLESGSVVAVFVSGNSVNRFNVTPAETPNTPTKDGGIGVSAPNHSSGGEGVQRIGNVEIRGNGGSARIWINNQDTGVRPANNTYTIVEFAGYTIEVFVRGNAILRWNLIGNGECPEPCPEPYIVEEYSFRQFVRLNQVDSRLDSRTEIADTRGSAFDVSHNAHQYHMGQSSDPRTAGVTGNGARITQFSATLTITFEYLRNYTEQFERIYEWVDVIVWSNDKRDEVVRPDSEHVHGGLVDGEEYSSEPRSGSNAFVVTYGGSILLHMGNQGLPHQRNFSYANDLFSVFITLHNTGNPPTVTVTHNAIVAELPNGL